MFLNIQHLKGQSKDLLTWWSIYTSTCSDKRIITPSLQIYSNNLMIISICVISHITLHAHREATYFVLHVAGWKRLARLFRVEMECCDVTAAIGNHQVVIHT